MSLATIRPAAAAAIASMAFALAMLIPCRAFALNATPASNSAIGWFPAVPDFGLDDYQAVASACAAQGYDWEAWFEGAGYLIDPACNAADLPIWLRNGSSGRGVVYTRTHDFVLEDGRSGLVLSLYEGTPLGLQSMQGDFDRLVQDQRFVPNEEIVLIQFSDPVAFGIGFFPAGVERLADSNGRRETSLVYVAACGSASFAGSWEAYAVLSYDDGCPEQVSAMTADSDQVFGRLNGSEGSGNRTVTNASSGTGLVLAGDGAWVLAPTVVTFSPPASFQFDNRGPFQLICEFDTAMEQAADPFYVDDGWILADTEVPGYPGLRWSDDHTVSAWCVDLTCPGPVEARVRASAARSAVGGHAIDGGVAGQTIGEGPNRDDFRYAFSTAASHSICMSWAVSFCKAGAFREGDATVVYWAVDYQRGTIAYDVYALEGPIRSHVAAIPARATRDAYSPAGYSVTVRSQARRFQIVEREAEGEATASRSFLLGPSPPDLERIVSIQDLAGATTAPIHFARDDRARAPLGGAAPLTAVATDAVATDYVFVVSSATPSWESALTPVTSRLSARGRTWQVVHAAASPSAIRGSLLPIYQAWVSQPAQSLRPRVVLLGAAYEDPGDPRNILGTFYREDSTGACTFTPTCSCDQLLVDFGGDLLPDLPLTRVPARTLAQLEHAVTTFQDVLDRSVGTQRHVVFMNGDMLADCVALEEPTQTLLDVRESYQEAGYAATWLADSAFDCDDFGGRRTAAVSAINQNRPCDLTGTGVSTQRFVGPGLFMQTMFWPYWDQSLVTQRLRLVGLFPGCDLADTDRTNDWGSTIGETWTLADPDGATASFWISHGRGHWGTGHLKWYREFMRWRVDLLATDFAEAMFLAIRDVGTRSPGLREYLTSVQALGWPVPLRLDPAAVDQESAGGGDAVRVLDNPARDRVAIHATVPAGSLGIEVFDVSGRRVATLVRDASVDAGTYTIRWDGRDAGGRPVPSGVYTVAVRSARGESVAKLTWLR